METTIIDTNDFSQRKIYISLICFVVKGVSVRHFLFVFKSWHFSSKAWLTKNIFSERMCLGTNSEHPTHPKTPKYIWFFRGIILDVEWPCLTTTENLRKYDLEHKVLDVLLFAKYKFCCQAVYQSPQKEILQLAINFVHIAVLIFRKHLEKPMQFSS